MYVVLQNFDKFCIPTNQKLCVELKGCGFEVSDSAGEVVTQIPFAS